MAAGMLVRPIQGRHRRGITAQIPDVEEWAVTYQRAFALDLLRELSGAVPYAGYLPREFADAFELFFQKVFRHRRPGLLQ
jgi:hypothetical protein